MVGVLHEGLDIGRGDGRGALDGGAVGFVDRDGDVGVGRRDGGAGDGDLGQALPVAVAAVAVGVGDAHHAQGQVGVLHDAPGAEGGHGGAGGPPAAEHEGGLYRGAGAEVVHGDGVGVVHAGVGVRPGALPLAAHGQDVVVGHGDVCLGQELGDGGVVDGLVGGPLIVLVILPIERGVVGVLHEGLDGLRGDGRGSLDGGSVGFVDRDGDVGVDRGDCGLLFGRTRDIDLRQAGPVAVAAGAVGVGNAHHAHRQAVVLHDAPVAEGGHGGAGGPQTAEHQSRGGGCTVAQVACGDGVGVVHAGVRVRPRAVPLAAHGQDVVIGHGDVCLGQELFNGGVVDGLVGGEGAALVVLAEKRRVVGVLHEGLDLGRGQRDLGLDGGAVGFVHFDRDVGVDRGDRGLLGFFGLGGHRDTCGGRRVVVIGRGDMREQIIGGLSLKPREFSRGLPRVGIGGWSFVRFRDRVGDRSRAFGIDGSAGREGAGGHVRRRNRDGHVHRFGSRARHHDGTGIQRGIEVVHVIVVERVTTEGDLHRVGPGCRTFGNGDLQGEQHPIDHRRIGEHDLSARSTGNGVHEGSVGDGGSLRCAGNGQAGVLRQG